MLQRKEGIVKKTPLWYDRYGKTMRSRKCIDCSEINGHKKAFSWSKNLGCSFHETINNETHPAIERGISQGNGAWKQTA